MLDRGRVGEAQVIPAGWLEDIFQDPGTAPWPGEARDGRRPYYRSFVWGHGDGHGTVTARGVHGQFIYVAPASGVVIVLLSSWPNADGGAPGVGEAESLALLKAIETAVR
jgi:CubicO group peptidase (beta-lactamase class C family)